MAGGDGIEAPSGPAAVEAVAGSARASALTPDVTAAGSQELARSSNSWRQPTSAARRRWKRS
eukprot:10208279-Alexandrium_andersonii.AAC.1